jgi:hypothetical protein
VVRERRFTDAGAPLQALQPVEGAESCHVERYPQGGRREADGTKYLYGTAFWDEKCTTAILEFLATTEVGMRGRQRTDRMEEEDPGGGSDHDDGEGLSDSEDDEDDGEGLSEDEGGQESVDGGMGEEEDGPKARANFLCTFIEG